MRNRSGKWFFGGLVAAFVGAACWAQVTVTPAGQPTYALPLTVPPGIAGMEPKLALQYDQGASGALGTGWTLSGLSTITRCGWTEAVDGNRRGVRFTSEDRFCLDGQRLIVVDGAGNPVAPQPPYTGGTTEYRTEKDSFARIRAYGGTASTGPSMFKVWTKAGLIFYYGGNDNAVMDTVGTPAPVTAAWGVSRVEDTVGNYMMFSYLKQLNSFAGSSGREWMIDQVRYTGKSGVLLPGNRVAFVYEDRPDKREAYHEGAKTVTTKRLASIETFVPIAGGERRVAVYKLQYGQSPHTGRSRLASFRQCSGLDEDALKCLPATEFTYSDGPPPTFVGRQDPSLTSEELVRADGSRGVYQGDFDGNGMQDVLVWDDDPTKNTLLLSQGDGSFRKIARPLPGDPPLGHSNACNYAVIADFNLDGVSDVLRVTNPDGGHWCSGVPRLTTLYLGSHTGAFHLHRHNLTREDGATLPLYRAQPGSVCNMSGDSGCYYTYEGGRSFSVVDVNGDGYPDILMSRTPGPESYYVRPWDCGDELTCLFLGTSTPGSFRKVGTTLAQENTFAPDVDLSHEVGLPKTYQSDRLFINDLNGDGLPEVLLRDKGILYVATGSEGGFARHVVPATCASGAEVLDINGDGKWDLACMDYSDPNPYKAYVNLGAGAYAERSNMGWAGATCPTYDESYSPNSPCHPSTRYYVNYLAADLDGDGVSDILALGKQAYAGGYPNWNGFLKGRPDGTFAPYAIPSLEAVKFYQDARGVLVGDFTGRGSVELLRYSPNPAENTLFVRDNSTPPDLLTSVTTVGNARSSITYRPLTDNVFYGRGTGAEYPVVDYIGPDWVVVSVFRPTGVPNTTTESKYAYFHKRFHLRGRGSLGFASMVEDLPSPNGTRISTRTYFHQDFPRTGLPSKVRRYLPARGTESEWISEVDTVWSTICPTAGSPALHRVVLAEKVEKTRDLGGQDISYVKTVNAYGPNCYGDPESVTITTKRSEGATEKFEKRTNNTYLPPVTSGDQWILGRLSSAVQTNSVPDAPFGPPRSPTQTAPTPPGAGPTLSAINAVINLLLLDD